MEKDSGTEDACGEDLGSRDESMMDSSQQSLVSSQSEDEGTHTASSPPHPHSLILGEFGEPPPHTLPQPLLTPAPPDPSSEPPSSQSQSQQMGHCYCGKERNLNIVELQCNGCRRWFHESCIGYQLGKLVPFMLNYVFTCKNCSNTGLEVFKKSQAHFTHMCLTALANLQQQSTKEGREERVFSRDAHIIPFMESHWESLTTMPRRNTAAWHNTIQRSLAKEKGMLFICEDKLPEGVPPTVPYPLYGLANPDLTLIRPLYEMQGGQRRGGAKRKADGGGGSGSGGSAGGGGSGSGGGKKQRGLGGEISFRSGSVHGYPLEHPFNKDGYRYLLAEPDPHAPFRQEFDESAESIGKPIPSWQYRVLTPPIVLLALHDRAPQLKMGEGRLSVTGDKGYCMIRANHYVNCGTWYWEAVVTNMPENSATRIGWAQAHANLQAPLGFDRFGYSWRSRKGTKFHEAHGKHYANGQGFGVGDILGFLIHLPQTRDPSVYLPPTHKDKPLVRVKNHLYYEEKENVQESLKILTPLLGGKITFFKNGVNQGLAFTDIYEGSYYPAISIYKNATVTVNFGPEFKHPPQEVSFQPMSNRAEESTVQQALSDMLYLTQNHGKLKINDA